MGRYKNEPTAHGSRRTARGSRRTAHGSRRSFRGALATSVAALVWLLAGCESSHILVGTARQPIPARQVTLYVSPPAGQYAQIAILETSSKHSLAFTEQGKTDIVLDRLRTQAARLGANGVLLRAVSDQPDGSFDTGLGTSFSGIHGTVGVGWGRSTGKSIKIGRGIAIYVRPSAGADSKADSPHP